MDSSLFWGFEPVLSIFQSGRDVNNRNRILREDKWQCKANHFRFTHTSMCFNKLLSIKMSQTKMFCFFYYLKIYYHSLRFTFNLTWETENRMLQLRTETDCGMGTCVFMICLESSCKHYFLADVQSSNSHISLDSVSVCVFKLFEAFELIERNMNEGEI